MGSSQITLYPIFEYSMQDVIRVGKKLKEPIPWQLHSDPETLETFAIANSWRDSHVLPMKSVRLSVALRMRHMGLAGDVVARAKRMSSIRSKLRRHPGNLSQIQDLGGCRAILDDIRGVQALTQECLERMPHEVTSHRDYIGLAKDDGYRSHHIIFKYRAEEDRAAYRVRKVELQVRTKLQHSWATAVEVIGQTRLEQLKAGVGSPGWLRFFKLMSDEFSYLEGCELDRVGPSRRVRLQELRELNASLRSLEILENHRTITRYLRSYILSRDARVFLIRYDNVQHTVTVEGYSDPTIGAMALHREERDIEADSEKQNSAVLVDAKEATSIVNAFPNYFGDVTLFASKLKNVCGIGDDPDYALPKQLLAKPKTYETPDLTWFKQRHRRWGDSRERGKK